jgi:hypothetical protein
MQLLWKKLFSNKVGENNSKSDQKNLRNNKMKVTQIMGWGVAKRKATSYHFVAKQIKMAKKTQCKILNLLTKSFIKMNIIK